MDVFVTRFNGTLKKWNAQRGFGFVVAERGGQELFVHVSALPRDGWIPVIGEPLSFEIEVDKEGRKRAVRVRRLGVPVAAAAKASRAEQARHQALRASHRAADSSSSFGTRLIGLLLVAGLGWYAYAQYTERVDAASRAAVAVPLGLMSNPKQVTAPRTQQPAFRCDGRQYCSQMTSCSEAKLFLKNCPGMKMDGNGDGVPCEQQWCFGD
jgi:cold shock CspA family protein